MIWKDLEHGCTHWVESKTAHFGSFMCWSESVPSELPPFSLVLSSSTFLKDLPSMLCGHVAQATKWAQRNLNKGIHDAGYGPHLMDFLRAEWCCRDASPIFQNIPIWFHLLAIQAISSNMSSCPSGCHSQWLRAPLILEPTAGKQFSYWHSLTSTIYHFSQWVLPWTKNQHFFLLIFEPKLGPVMVRHLVEKSPGWAWLIDEDSWTVRLRPQCCARRQHPWSFAWLMFGPSSFGKQAFLISKKLTPRNKPPKFH